MVSTTWAGVLISAACLAFASLPAGSSTAAVTIAARNATIALALTRGRVFASYFAGWLRGTGMAARLGERPATFSAEGSKRRKRSGAATPSLSLQRGQSPAAAATVALNLLSHRSQ
jgi:hypothetical protein